MNRRHGRRIDEGILRRHFVAIATSTYDSSPVGDLPGVEKEVEAFENWLCDQDLGDRRFRPQYRELRDSPTDGLVSAVLRRPDPGVVWNESDAAVLLVTGHGHTDDNNSHWLVLRNTDTGNLATTGLRTAELICWLRDTRIEHLLIVLDVCFAGRTARDLLLGSDKDIPDTWLILSSAKGTQEAMVGAFSRAVTEVLAELGTGEGEKYGSTHPYLKVEDFIDEINGRLVDQKVEPIQGSQTSGFHVCLPNPHFRPQEPTALLTADLKAHWGPRSRGATTSDDPSWLFSGREELMQRLIAAATGEPGTLLVTGRAGSGKSAALARLVTLSDETYCAKHAKHARRVPDNLRPPLGAVDAAVLATGKNAVDIMTQLCRMVGARPATSGSPLRTSQITWQEWISTHDGPVTVVIDALDEASHPELVVSEVLERLQPAAGPPRVRLLVGVRTPGGGHGREKGLPSLDPPIADLIIERLAVDDEDRVAVDQSPWWVHSDVIEYATGLLQTPEGSPYRESPRLVKEIAEVLADRVGTSFLVAKLAAEDLATRPTVIDPDDPAWRASISNGVLGVFRADLQRNISPEKRIRAVHLLRAVAFACGRGIPWRIIWPCMASAVANDTKYPDWIQSYGDSDIAWLLGTRIGGYLVTDQEDDTTVYRLFHDDLSAILRDQWYDLLTEPG